MRKAFPARLTPGRGRARYYVRMVVVVDVDSADAVLTGGAVVLVPAAVVPVVVVGADVPVANAAARTRRSLACFNLLMAVVGSPFVSAV